MPANRSRTQQWRRCLDQIYQRGGSLDITIADQSHEGERGKNLIWRVRMLLLNDHELVVEEPSTLGQTIHLHRGIELVAIVSIGQNRWMFNTCVLSRVRHGEMTGLRLAMPTSVERCQRRNFYRVDTAELALPQVRVWPLLDPKSVILAERANELQLDLRTDGVDSPQEREAPAEDLLPEVGPGFNSLLVNIGGGGVGLYIRPHDGQALARHKLFWLRFALPPHHDTPICASAKLAHTHMQTHQALYAGLAFDFSFNPGHQRYVVEQICQYIALQQQLQFAARADEPERRSA